MPMKLPDHSDDLPFQELTIADLFFLNYFLNY